VNMNREMKRRMQRQGQVGEDGSPASVRRQAPPRPAPRPASQRTSPAEFVREVQSELRKVAWPNREETINSSIVVFIALAAIMIVIVILDYLFGKSALYLFK